MGNGTTCEANVASVSQQKIIHRVLNATSRARRLINKMEHIAPSEKDNASMDLSDRFDHANERTESADDASYYLQCRCDGMK